MLLVLNHELGANFDPANFEHRAFYEPVTDRIEMHLVSTLEHEVRVPGIGWCRLPKVSRSGRRSAASTTAPAYPNCSTAAGLRLEAWRPDRGVVSPS